MLWRCHHWITPKRGSRKRGRTCNRVATHCVRTETEIVVDDKPMTMVSTGYYACPKHAAAYDMRAGAKVMQPVVKE